MPCHPISFPGGGSGFVCTSGRGRGKRCHYCGRAAGFLCDHKVTILTTCDRPICADHATRVGPERDLCPDHAPPAAPLQVFTARLSSALKDPDVLDITRAGADRARKKREPAPGEPFAPSWAILGPAIEARRLAAMLRKLGARGCYPANLAGPDADATEAEAWATYRPLYLAEMLVSSGRPVPEGWRLAAAGARARGVIPQPGAWTALLRRRRVVLCCTCTGGRERCHRGLLAGIFVKLGAVDGGEFANHEPAAEQLQLLTPARAPGSAPTTTRDRGSSPT